MMFAEEFFEKVAEQGILPIVFNFGDFLILIIAMVVGCVLWLIPFIVMFLPLYYELFVDFIKCKLNNRRSNG